MREKHEARTVVLRVCSKCGSTELTSPSYGSYSPHAPVIPGLNELIGLRECLKCGFVGFPKTVRKKLPNPKRLKKASTK